MSPPDASDLAPSLSGVRAAVLGANGFIGRWVARRLTELGAETLCVVRAEATAAALRRSGWVPEARVALGDVTRPASLRAALAAARPHVVFNLAGYGITRDERDEALLQAVNVEAAGALAGVVRDVGDPGWPGTRLVHAGTALEYGLASGDLDEATPPLPFEPYGRSKAAGTAALAASAEGLPCCTARLFTVYGPGERPGRLVPTLLAARSTAAPIQLSAGTQRRDFVYVEDAADFLVRLALARTAPGEAVNVATGRLTTVREFIERAARTLGIAAERLAFGAVPLQTAEQAHDPLSVARLRALTGGRPDTTIEEGVRRTAAFDLAAPTRASP